MCHVGFLSRGTVSAHEAHEVKTAAAKGAAAPKYVVQCEKLMLMYGGGKLLLKDTHLSLELHHRSPRRLL